MGLFFFLKKKKKKKKSLEINENRYINIYTAYKGEKKTTVFHSIAR